jgi:hypothetical protein
MGFFFCFFFARSACRLKRQKFHSLSHLKKEVNSVYFSNRIRRRYFIIASMSSYYDNPNGDDTFAETEPPLLDDHSEEEVDTPPGSGDVRMDILKKVGPFTPFQLLWIFTIMNLLTYFDRGALAVSEFCLFVCVSFLFVFALVFLTMMLTDSHPLSVCE